MVFWVVFILGIILIIVVGVPIAIYLIAIYNRLNVSRINIEKCWGRVQVVYQRRSDLIPKLVDLTGQYTSHEKGLLTKITDLRSQWSSAKSPEDKITAADKLDSAISRLLVVAENYPNLKANESFLQIQKELSEVTEEEIREERMRYNDAVTPYNTVVICFPSNIAAKILGFKKMEFYGVGK